MSLQPEATPQRLRNHMPVTARFKFENNTQTDQILNSDLLFHQLNEILRIIHLWVTIIMHFCVHKLQQCSATLTLFHPGLLSDWVALYGRMRD
jgi:hypothetical protein